MNVNRFPIVLLTIIALGLGVALSRTLAAEPPSERTSDVTERLEVRYARAYLQLAQADLQIAREANEKVGGVYPAAALEPLRQVVAIAEEQLRYALEQNSHDLHTVHIRQAEAVVAEAERDLQRVVEANQNLPGLSTPAELHRARLRLEAANLALEKARSVDTHNATEHTQWQLEELRKELLQLRSKIERRPR